MNKLIISICMMLLLAISSKAETPDFSCVGFAGMNGGTTGGQGGQVVTVTNLDQFKKYVGEKDATKRVIYVNGKLEGAGGGEMIAIGSNKTIIGVGVTGEVLKVQFYCKNSKNLIFKNLFFSMANSTLGSDADCISIATTGSDKCQNIWVDHCTFDNKVNPIANPSASQKDQYDGLLDIKKNSDYITISWCKFKNHYKGILVGYTSSDTYDRKITLHHNSFVNIGSRTPSYRGGTAHVYNNYWEGCFDSGKYFSTGVNCREGACLYVESNYFKNMNKTIYCAWDDVSQPGYASWQNNVFENASTPESDAAFTPCTSFTPPYTVTKDDANAIPALVLQYAGYGVLADPTDIPQPETGGGTTPTIQAPYLHSAANICGTGFDISWDAVADANKYIVKISHEEEQSGAPAPLFLETFNSFTTAITTDALTSGKTDNPVSKYQPNGSSPFLCSENGTMDLKGGRFVIAGLDFSTSPTLYIKCKYISGTGKFIVTYATGTSSTGAVYNAAASTIGTAYTTLQIPLSGAATTIQLRTESSTVIRIDEMSISNGETGPSTITDTYTIDAPVTSHSFTNLTAGTEYTVEVVAKNSNGDSSSSSNVIYVTPTVVTNLNAISLDNMRVYTSGNSILISGMEENVKTQVYNMLGMLLYNGKTTAETTTIPQSFSKGMYLVNVGGKSVKIAVK